MPGALAQGINHLKKDIKKHPSVLPVLGFLGMTVLGGALFTGYSMLQLRRPEIIENNKTLIKLRHVKRTPEEREAMLSNQKKLEDLRKDLGFTYELPK